MGLREFNATVTARVWRRWIDEGAVFALGDGRARVEELAASLRANWHELAARRECVTAG